MATQNERKYVVKPTEELPVYSHNIYALNPMGIISNGVGKSDRVGERIQNVVLRVKLNYLHKGLKIDPFQGNTYVWPKSKLRVMVIRTKRELTQNSFNWANITSTVGRSNSTSARDDSLFYQPDGWVYPYHINISDIKKDNSYEVLLDKQISSARTGDLSTLNNTQSYGTEANCQFQIKLPQFEYKENTTGYANTKNTYIIIGSSMARSFETDQAGDVACHYSLQWTDS